MSQTEKLDALDRLIAAVEAGGDWIGRQASEALDPQQYVDALRAYGEGGTRPSLDAAKALHDALLPGWTIISIRDAMGGTGYRVSAQDKALCHPDAKRAEGEAATMARAWLLCTLRAYRAQIGGEA